MKAAGLPQHVIDAMSDEDRKALKLKSSDQIDKFNEDRDEKIIQRMIEAYLIQLGFERLTEDNINRCGTGFPARGWQYHLSPLGAKKNPMLPDITVFDYTGRYLWLELKAKNGKLSPLQKIMVDQEHWQVAYGEEQAIRIIKDWLRHDMDEEEQ